MTWQDVANNSIDVISSELGRLRGIINAVPSTGNPGGAAVHYVRDGDDLQHVLDTSKQGDIIQLGAGVRFVGNFRLRNKVGSDWITIRSSRHANIGDDRVITETSSLMPKIVSPNTQPAIAADFGTHHQRFDGIEVTTTHAQTSTTQSNLILFGYENGKGATDYDELPDEIAFDRCYIHGTPTGNCRRGLTLNCRSVSVTRCHLSNFHEIGADSQGIECWNGAGPFHIEDNRIEAAGENIMFGGGRPTIEGLVPTDIQIINNDLYKPDSWRHGHPVLAGRYWSVKNLLELKNARNVVIRGNRMSNCWVGSQHGFAMVLTPRGESGTAPWSVVENVAIAENRISDTRSGIHISSGDIDGGSERTNNITISDNVLHGIPERMFLLIGYTSLPSMHDVKIVHNTCVHKGQGRVFLGLGDSGTVVERLEFVDNIVTNARYGLHGSGAGVGTPALERYVDSYEFRNNLIIGTEPWMKQVYHPHQLLVDKIDDVGFVDAVSNDYRLSDSSEYATSGTDGEPLGARSGGG